MRTRTRLFAMVALASLADPAAIPPPAFAAPHDRAARDSLRDRSGEADQSKPGTAPRAPATVLADASKPDRPDSNVPQAFGSAVTKFGQSGAWGIYRYGSATGPACYALSVPVERAPAYDKDVFFTLARRPGANARYEPQLMMEEAFASGSKVTVAVGGRTRKMFVHGKSAWLENAPHEPLLVAEMRSGSTMNVSTRLRDGRTYTFTFSLAGISAALATIEGGC